MDYRQPFYPAAPQTVNVSPQRNAIIESVPIVRVEKNVSSNERHVTDIRSLFIFCCALLICACISFQAIVHGSGARLSHGVNYNGGVCGWSRGLTSYPYLYYPLDTEGGRPRLLASARKCIQICPTAADVKAHTVIPITKIQLDVSARSSAATLIEYTVNSPVYVTTPFGGRLCIPNDRTLAAQLSQAYLSSPLLLLRILFGSVATAWPPIFVSLFAAFIMALGCSWLFRSCAKLLLPLSVVVAVMSGITFSGLLLIAAASIPTMGSDFMSRAPLEASGCLLVCKFFLKFWNQMGLLLLVVTAALPTVLFVRRESASETTRVLESSGDVLWSRGTLESSTLLSAIMVLFNWFWIYVLTLLLGMSTSSYGNPIPLSNNRNGGVAILPMERADRMPVWVGFAIPIWIFLSLWLIEFIFTIHRFSVCYAGKKEVKSIFEGAMYYFTSDGPMSEEEAFHGPPRIAPSFVALSIGLINHTGSLAAAALAFLLLRPYVAMRRILRLSRYDCGDAKGHGEELSYLISTNGFVEMAVASTSLRTSMKTAATRSRHPNSVTARLLGAGQLASIVAGIAIVLFCGLLTFSIIARNRDYSQPTSKYFVPAPLFATLDRKTAFADQFNSNMTEPLHTGSDIASKLKPSLEEILTPQAPSSTPKKRYILAPTPFGVNRYLLLVIITFYASLVGSHFFNWTPWERILLQSGAYSELCPSALENCREQQDAISSILPLTTVAMFSFTLVAGLCLDIIGPKTCCIFGNTLLIIGWILLAFSSPSVDTYKVGFIFMGAGTDPAFFGTLSIANLFPGYGSTVIAILGAARSLSNLWPWILQFVSSENFHFARMALLFIVTYCACLVLVILLIPTKSYIPPISGLTELQVDEIDHKEQSLKDTVVNLLPDNLDTRGTSRVMDEQISIDNNDLSTSSPKSCRMKMRSNCGILKHQLNGLRNHMTSLSYLPVVLITIINVIRNNFYLTTALKQLGPAERFLSILNVLAFIPGPILGLIVDRFGPLSVITGINTCNLIVYVMLVLAETVAKSNVIRDVLNYLSVAFAFPGIGFLLSQIYCYIAVVFPAEDMGKLAGFASCIAGLCGLVVTPMTTFSKNIGKFWPMNLANIATSGVNYALVLFLIWWQRREPRRSTQTTVVEST